MIGVKGEKIDYNVFWRRCVSLSPSSLVQECAKNGMFESGGYQLHAEQPSSRKEEVKNVMSGRNEIEKEGGKACLEMIKLTCQLIASFHCRSTFE